MANKYVLDKSQLCTHCVTNGLHVWPLAEKDTAEKTCIRVLTARSVSLLGVNSLGTWLFVRVNTSAGNAAGVVRAVVRWKYTDEFIRGRNRLNVLFAVNDRQRHVTSKYTVEFTVEINRTNVTCAGEHSVSPELCTVTWKSRGRQTTRVYRLRQTICKTRCTSRTR